MTSNIRMSPVTLTARWNKNGRMDGWLWIKIMMHEFTIMIFLLHAPVMFIRLVGTFSKKKIVSVIYSHHIYATTFLSTININIWSLIYYVFGLLLYNSLKFFFLCEERGPVVFWTMYNISNFHGPSNYQPWKHIRYSVFMCKNVCKHYVMLNMAHSNNVMM